MKKMLSILGIVVVFAVTACSGTQDYGWDALDTDSDIQVRDQGLRDPGPANPGAQDVSLWASPGQPPEFKGEFYDRHVRVFARVSRWFTHVRGKNRPDTGHLGAFGVGNGNCFGILGMTKPLNTLHELIGPVYEKGNGFFGDSWLEILDAQDHPVVFDKEWAFRSLAAPVVITRGENAVWRMDTVDFAPWTDSAAKDCFIRVVLVTNLSDGDASSAKLRLHTFNRVKPWKNGVIENKTDKWVISRFSGMNPSTGKHGMTVSIPVLKPGGQWSVVISHCTGTGDPAGPPKINADALLDETRQRYQAWEAGLLHVDLPDPMVSDFIDGMKQTLKVQTTTTGANCPMSEYTRVWARDSIGAMLAWLDMGAFDDAHKLIDYIYTGILKGKGLGNSYAADLDVTKKYDPIDWSKQAPLTGRVGAETPSYMVLEYALDYSFTGDSRRIQDRWGFLKYCLMKQDFSPEKLLPFTGDETFRTMMDAAFGLDLSYEHSKRSWSANSSFLWLGAQKYFAMMGRALGKNNDVRASAELASQVEKATIEHYLLSDGCFAAYEDRKTGKPSPPFEDSSLKATWTGWLAGTDPRAEKALKCLCHRIEQQPGILQTPLDPKYKNFHGLKMEKGMYTGMLPGYTLRAMTDIGYSHAMAAFNAVALSLSSSGNLGEAMIFDDHSGLTLIYDQGGALGDYTAKFRPWEGGIVLDAVLKYLVGFRPDAPDAMFGIRPHLPNGWPFARYEGLRMGDARFDLDLQRTGTGVDVKLTSHANHPVKVVIQWDCQQSCGDISVDGKSVVERTGHGLDVYFMVSRAIELQPGTGVNLSVRRGR